MELSLYNTAARKKQIFEPINPESVGMYVCGPTVYDYAHIGNARPFVIFDVLYRILKRKYEKVTYVRNITDVDDKIIDASNNSGEDIDLITSRTIDAFHKDMMGIGNLPPDVEPAATNHISQMQVMIQELLDLGHAYESSGHVLFSIASMPEYGKFSGHNRDEMIAGARVEIAPYKRDPADFVMWKPSNSDQPGWGSPWGRGRPGWHIECSAMSREYLGKTFDIHGGGRDLVFPHHENELAQSFCAHKGVQLARYWLHNGFVTVSGEKMAKSLGNILTINSLLKNHSGETIKLALLSAHYRQPMDWTPDVLAQAKKALDRWYRAASVQPDLEGEVDKTVLKSLYDDLNTPGVIASLHRLADEALAGSLQAAADLRKSAGIIGILQQDSDSWFQSSEGLHLENSKIELLIERRDEARSNRDYAEADRIRAELESAGIILEDGDSKTKWRRAG